MQNPRKRLVAAALAAAALVAGGPARAASCVDSLEIDAPQPAGRALARRLHRGELAALPPPSCARARVNLEPRERGLRVRLQRGDSSVARDVDSLEAAAQWLENWLSPELYLPSTPSPTPHDVDASVPAADRLTDATPPEARATLRGRVGVGGRAGLDDDSARWLGVSLFGSLDVGGPFWLGASLGRSWDPLLGRSALGPEVSRRTTRVLVQGGGRWPLVGTSALRLGMGLGLLAAVADGPALEGSQRVVDDEAVGLMELTAAIALPVGAWELSVGLDLERSIDLESVDARQPDEPVARAYPNWRGGLSISLALPLGATPEPAP